MKIDVTYEKADILRLVTEDLVRKGIQPKAGARIEYKGALSVKLSVDAEADNTEVASPPPVATPPSPPIPEASMDEILAASRRAASTPPSFNAEGRPPRMLGKNESYEYPED